MIAATFPRSTVIESLGRRNWVESLSPVTNEIFFLKSRRNLRVDQMLQWQRAKTDGELLDEHISHSTSPQPDPHQPLVQLPLWPEPSKGVRICGITH